MRAPSAATSSGMSNRVNSKWPRWFVPELHSKPSDVVPKGVNMTPALFISTSIVGATAAIAAAARRTSANDVRSSATVDVLACGTSAHTQASHRQGHPRCGPRERVCPGVRKCPRGLPAEAR